MDANSESRSVASFFKLHGKYYIFGLGEFGFSFFVLFIAYQLLFFLTDVLKWPSHTAAVVYTTIQWFEGTTAVLMGIVIERVNLKIGKYRPWMLLGALGCGIFTILFFVDWSGPLWLEVGAFCLFYLLAYSSYNVMWVAYRSMVGVSSVSAKDNVSFTSCSAQLGGVAIFIYAALGGPILHAFNDIRYGYLLSALLCGVMMIGGMAVASISTRKFDNRNTVRVSRRSEGENKLDWNYIKTCLNRPMIVYFIGNSIRNSNAVIMQSLLIYYFTYVMGDSGKLSIYVTIMSLTVIIGQFPANALARRFGKTVMYQVSAILSVVSILSLNFINGNLLAFEIIAVLNTFANIFSGSMIPAFINEIADYTEYEHGVDGRSVIVSIGATATRFASIIGGAFAAFGLSAIGYKSGAVVAADFAVSITRLLSYSSALCVGLGAIAFLFYPLTDKKMQSIYKLKAEQLHSEAKAVPSTAD